METSVKEIGPLKKEIFVKISGDDVSSRKAKTIGMMASRLNLKGFRKGKMPKDIASRYVDTRAEEQVLMDLLRDTMEDALKEAGIGLSDFSRIGFYIHPILDDSSFEYSMQVRMYPEVDPEKYMGIEVSIKEPAQITPEDVEKRIEDMQKEALKPEEKDGVVETGDLVNLTYSRYEEGNPEPVLKDFNTALRVEADKELLIEGLKDAILGLKKDETFDVTGHSTVGKDMKIYRLAGKVDRVSNMVMPELNDDLARQFGADNVDALREQVLQTMQEEREARRKALIEDAIRTKLSDIVPTDDDITIMRERFAEMDDETFQDSEFFEDPENITRMAKIIREEAVLMAIAMKENIEIAEEDIENELQSIAAASGQPLPYVRAQSRSRIEDGSMVAQVRQKKVMDLLARYAKVNDDKNANEPDIKTEDDTDAGEEGDK